MGYVHPNIQMLPPGFSTVPLTRADVNPKCPYSGGLYKKLHNPSSRLEFKPAADLELAFRPLVLAFRPLVLAF